MPTQVPEAEKMRDIAYRVNQHTSRTQRDTHKCLKQIRKAARGGHYDCHVFRSVFFRGWTSREAKEIIEALQGMGFTAKTEPCFGPGHFLSVSWDNDKPL